MEEYNKKDILISVIVPVYNTKDYLDTCIDSIVNQTHSNLEIIIVDDGSTDGSAELCDAWAKKDNRVKVIHKENGGQAEARNVGIECAKGKYIGFVDSDDFVDEHMYEYLVELAERNAAEVTACAMQKFAENPFAGFEQEKYEELVFSAKEAIEDLINTSHFDNTVPNLLVQSNIAKSVKFDVGKVHEDVLWPYRVFRKANKLVYSNKKLYAYYQREGSTMNSAYSAERFDALDALQQKAIEIKEDFPALYSMAERSYIGACMYHYQTICRLEKSEEYEKFKQILYKRFVNGDRKTAFKNVGLKYRIWYGMFSLMPNFTSKIRNLLKIGL